MVTRISIFLISSLTCVDSVTGTHTHTNQIRITVNTE